MRLREIRNLPEVITMLIMSADTLQTGDGDCEKRDLRLNYAYLKKQNRLKVEDCSRTI